MKRSKALMSLSREHHTALVLAKRAQRLAQGEAGEALEFMHTLAGRFAAELEPHFQIEEAGLLAALARLDEHGMPEMATLIERTHDDHQALRELAGRIRQQDFNSLQSFGELLESHVRFEERELFNAAEAALPAAVLAALESAGPSGAA
jgi:hemerythrin-like domain-containing protein